MDRRGALVSKRVPPAPGRIAYTLKLTPSEISAVEFARGRYSWPDQLYENLDLETNTVELTEARAWDWLDAITDDEQGGHAPFAFASPAFVEKLWRFRNKIV